MYILLNTDGNHHPVNMEPSMHYKGHAMDVYCKKPINHCNELVSFFRCA